MRNQNEAQSSNKASREHSTPHSLIRIFGLPDIKFRRRCRRRTGRRRLCGCLARAGRRVDRRFEGWCVGRYIARNGAASGHLRKKEGIVLAHNHSLGTDAILGSELLGVH